MSDLSNNKRALHFLQLKSTIVLQKTLATNNFFDDKDSAINFATKLEASALTTIKNAQSCLPYASDFTLQQFNAQIKWHDIAPSDLGSRDLPLLDIQIDASALATNSIVSPMMLSLSAASALALEWLNNDYSLKAYIKSEVLKYKNPLDFYKKLTKDTFKCGVIVCSDSISKGVGVDKSGQLIKSILEGYHQEVLDPIVVPDEGEDIKSSVLSYANKGCHFVFLTGGTGFGPRDVTTKALLEIIDKRALGIEQALRHYGDERFPLGMLSNSVAGVVKETLVVAMPGSPGGVKDSLSAILPMIFHVPHILGGGKH